MSRGQQHRAGGFTLVELAVVLMIIAVLTAIAIPTYAGLTNGANDIAAQSLLRNALSAERYHHAVTGEFTRTRAEVESIEPSFIWNASGNPPGTVRVRMNNTRASFEVCLYSQSESGTWFAIYHNENTGTLYGVSDRLRGCSANTAARRWTEGW